jgi:hypothetical protein
MGEVPFVDRVYGNIIRVEGWPWRRLFRCGCGRRYATLALFWEHANSEHGDAGAP